PNGYVALDSEDRERWLRRALATRRLELALEDEQQPVRPASATGSATRAFTVDKNVDVRAYQSGNFIDSDKQVNPGGQPDGTDTGWGMFGFNTIIDQTLTQMATPFAAPPVTTQSAIDAYQQIINHVGNFWWSRDAIDSRVIGNVQNNTNAPAGVAASAPDATELNGLLNAPVVNHPAGWDSDGDGMPNSWEVAHGLNPNSSPASPDWKLDFDNDGYINLIEYINESGEFPAPAPIVFNGATNNRYAVITNWKTNDGGITAGSNWQPSIYDEAQINNGVAVVDSIGQHAGLLVLAANAGNNALLNITAGWLKVADALVIGGDDAATATLNLSGGLLSAPVLAKGAGGAFNFTGGILHAETIGFDLQNQGGLFAPGNSIGAAHVMGDLALTSGSMQIELASADSSDTVQVDGSVTLGGSLEVALLGGFAPSNGESWQIIGAAGGVGGAFNSVTPGYSVQQQGNNLMLFFGAAPPLLAGDFNDDGMVDAADYIVWRKTGGTQAEYETWRANFGATSGTGGVSLDTGAVPEPATCALLLAGLIPWLTVSRRLRVFGRFLQE
ncbi:MAG: thrombospondin type 3 repeat-containing protein, partial [Pirellulales bacterium]